MTHTTDDVIDHLVGIRPGSALDAVRARRPAARENAQKSYLALFEPAQPGTVTLEERLALALFVVALHRNDAVTAFYRNGLSDHARDGLVDHARDGLVAALDDEVRRGLTHGPYGRYPDGPLSRENAPGIVHRVTEGNRRVLGSRLSAAFEHAHLLVFRPRDASPAALDALLDGGWTTSEIVTLSQIVAFLSFQVRVVTGFRALAAQLAVSSISQAAVA